MSDWFQVVRDQVARYTDEELKIAFDIATRWIATGDAPASAAMLLRAVRDEARYRAAEDAALEVGV